MLPCNTVKFSYHVNVNTNKWITIIPDHLKMWNAEHFQTIGPFQEFQLPALSLEADERNRPQRCSHVWSAASLVHPVSVSENKSTFKHNVLWWQTTEWKGSDDCTYCTYMNTAHGWWQVHGQLVIPHIRRFFTKLFHHINCLLVWAELQESLQYIINRVWLSMLFKVVLFWCYSHSVNIQPTLVGNTRCFTTVP